MKTSSIKSSKDALATYFLLAFLFHRLQYICIYKLQKVYETAVAFTANMRLMWKVLSNVKRNSELYSIHRIIREFYLFVYMKRIKCFDVSFLFHSTNFPPFVWEYIWPRAMFEVVSNWLSCWATFISIAIPLICAHICSSLTIWRFRFF